MSTTLRILGIDPGLRVTGYGVIDKVGNRLQYVSCGVIRIPEDELPGRLLTILQGIQSIIEQHKPNESAVEKVFVNVNPQSTLLLGQARGAAISALVLAGLPVFEYTALQVKQAVVGNGKAKKEQVQEMVKRLLNLPAVPSTDAADALACAISHANSEKLTSKLSLLAPTLGKTGLRVRGGRIV